MHGPARRTSVSCRGGESRQTWWNDELFVLSHIKLEVVEMYLDVKEQRDEKEVAASMLRTFEVMALLRLAHPPVLDQVRTATERVG